MPQLRRTKLHAVSLIEQLCNLFYKYTSKSMFNIIPYTLLKGCLKRMSSQNYFCINYFLLMSVMLFLHFWSGQHFLLGQSG